MDSWEVGLHKWAVDLDSWIVEMVVEIYGWAVGLE